MTASDTFENRKAVLRQAIEIAEDHHKALSALSDVSEAVHEARMRALFDIMVLKQDYERLVFLGADGIAPDHLRRLYTDAGTYGAPWHTKTVVEVWHAVDGRQKGREDATWYVDPSEPNRTLVTVQGNGRSVDVCVDGRLHVDLYSQVEGKYVKASEAHEARDLEAFGITDDTSLVAACEQGTFVWANNPWYSLYRDTPLGYEGGEEVYETLTDAIAAAKRAVSSR